MRAGRRRSWVSAMGVGAMVAGMSIAGAPAAGAAVGTPSLVAGSPFDVNDYGAGGMSNIGAAAQSPDGTLLALGREGLPGDAAVALYRLDADGAPVIASVHTASDGDPAAVVPALEFSPDGALLAAPNADNDTVSIFTVAGGVPTLAGSVCAADGAPVHAPAPGACPVASPASVAFSPDGLLVAVANADNGTVSIFTVSGGTLTKPTAVCAADGGAPGPGGCPDVGPASVAFSPDGTLLAVANSRDDTVSILVVTGGGLAPGVVTCAADGTPPAPGPCPSAGPASVAFSPDGALLAVANAGVGVVSSYAVGVGGVPTYSGSVCAADGSAPGPGGCPAADPELVAFTPDGGSLAVANVGSRSAPLFAVSGGALTSPPVLLPLTDAGLVAMSVAAAPGGGYRIVLAGRNDGVSDVWVYAASPLPPPPPAVVAPPPSSTVPVPVTVAPTTTTASTPTPAPISSSSSKLAPAPAVTTPAPPAPPPATLAATGITTGWTLSLAALLILAGAGLLFAAGRWDRRGAA